MKGYHQIELHPDSRPLTATMTPLGLRQYCRLPLGLTDSGATMQQALEETLASIEGVAVYVDDILIFAETKEAHDHILRQVLHRLHANDFRLQIRKCLFHINRVAFLGHIISGDGISPDPETVQAIQEAPVPTVLKQVCSFLGAVGFYSPYIENLADLAEPLCAMTRGQDPHFYWSPDCQSSFDSLKSAISSHMLLCIFDPRCPTYVNVDASDVGLGRTLTQDQEGKEVTIMCISHTLTDTERRYSATEKEALACLWAVEHFEKFLLGHHFTLRTDHSSLQQILTSPLKAEGIRKMGKYVHWAE